MQGAGECVRRRLLPLTHPPPAYGKCLFRSSALLLLREITSELFKTDEIRHVEMKKGKGMLPWCASLRTTTMKKGKGMLPWSAS